MDTLTAENLTYQSPLIYRYASKEMASNFSNGKKFTTWRRLWLWLAEAEREIGLQVTEDQIQEMKDNVNSVDFKKASEEESECRHDVMAHIRTFAVQCPNAAPIIHLGATSCFVGDNADLMMIKDGIDLVLAKLSRCIDRFSTFANRHKDLPCLAYTHLQPAQPTTVGKRASLWTQELLMCLHCLERTRENMRFRGVKGTTGTQASFCELLTTTNTAGTTEHGCSSGNGYPGSDLIDRLDKLVSEKAGFSSCYTVCGQTYPRLADVEFLHPLSMLGSAVHKICTDLRLLASFREVLEPAESTQVGSSAMPYKRNPMRCERACSLAKHLMSLPHAALNIAATQWMERTLDDSAARRLYIPEAFLSADAILLILQNVAEGLVVNEQIISRRLSDELPFMATERILMAMVNSGQNRQECHERLRQLSAQSSAVILAGGANDLLDRIRTDQYFMHIHDQLTDLLDARNYVGRAPEQVSKFLREEVHPVLQRYEGTLQHKAGLTV